MSLEIIRKIDVDFYSNKLIYVNAKQNDMSRFILLTCYDQGKKVFIDNTTNLAYVRCKKPDNNGVINECTITENGEIMVELTEQMLAVSGNILVDILVYNTTNVLVSTMNFCINVIRTALDNSEIESSSEYKALNSLIIEAKAEYDYVIEESRKNLEITTQNAKNSTDSAEAAKVSENNAKISENNAKLSEVNAKTSSLDAQNYANSAKESENNAKQSELNAKQYEEVILSKINSVDDSVLLAESWAVGNTGIRENENIDNSKYYSEQAKIYYDSIESSSNIARSYAVGDIGYRDGEATDNAKYYYELSKTLAGNLQVATVSEVQEFLGIN